MKFYKRFESLRLDFMPESYKISNFSFRPIIGLFQIYITKLSPLCCYVMNIFVCYVMLENLCVFQVCWSRHVDSLPAWTVCSGSSTVWSAGGETTPMIYSEEERYFKTLFCVILILAVYSYRMICRDSSFPILSGILKRIKNFQNRVFPFR